MANQFCMMNVSDWSANEVLKWNDERKDVVSKWIFFKFKKMNQYMKPFEKFVQYLTTTSTEQLFDVVEYATIWEHHFLNLDVGDYVDEGWWWYLHLLSECLFKDDIMPIFTTGLLHMLDHLFGVVPSWQNYRNSLPPTDPHINHVFHDDANYVDNATIILCPVNFCYETFDDWSIEFHKLMQKLLESDTMCYLQILPLSDYETSSLYTDENKLLNGIELNMRNNRTRYAIMVALLCAKNSLNSSLWYAIADNFYHFTALDERVKWTIMV